MANISLNQLYSNFQYTEGNKSISNLFNNYLAASGTKQLSRFLCTSVQRGNCGFTSNSSITLIIDSFPQILNIDLFSSTNFTANDLFFMQLVGVNSNSVNLLLTAVDLVSGSVSWDLYMENATAGALYINYANAGLSSIKFKFKLVDNINTTATNYNTWIEYLININYTPI